MAVLFDKSFSSLDSASAQAALVVTLVALMAALAPARRAASVEPSSALRA